MLPQSVRFAHGRLTGCTSQQILKPIHPTLLQRPYTTIKSIILPANAEHRQKSNHNVILHQHNTASIQHKRLKHSHHSNNQPTIPDSIRQRKRHLIMVCVDGSNNSLRAFNAAKHMCNPTCNDVLLVVHCCNQAIDASINAPSENVHAGILYRNPHQLQSEIMKRISEDTLHRIESKNVKYMNIEMESDIDIRDKLVDLVHEYTVDYLFVGRRSGSRANKLSIGSTAQYILQHAATNVVLVK